MGNANRLLSNQNELSHFGIPGMKWGVRRSERALQKAERLATKSGLSSARSKAAIRTSNKAAETFDKVAKKTEANADQFTKQGARIRSVMALEYAKANSDKANALRSEGKDYSRYYKRAAEIRKMKAYKLADKYGDAETKKRIDSIIKKNSNKKLDDEFEYDMDDPIVSSVKKIFE